MKTKKKPKKESNTARDLSKLVAVARSSFLLTTFFAFSSNSPPIAVVNRKKSEPNEA